MSRFEELRKSYLDDREKQIAINTEYITKGYCSTWCENERKESDNGIRRYLTDLRWNQYQAGEISREKAIDYAVKRMVKEANKTTQKGLAKLEAVENAEELTFASVTVTYSRYYNASAESYTNNGRFFGHAGGYGYDKTSSAVAEAFNNDMTMLKILYSLKEKGLKEGLTSDSKSACTGHDNRNIIGYKTSIYNGKREFAFRIEKEA